MELIEIAVNGTLNVLKACSEVKIKRLVVVSSIASVFMNPVWPKGQVMDETCWSDADYCRKTKVTFQSTYRVTLPHSNMRFRKIIIITIIIVFLLELVLCVKNRS